MNKFAEIFPPGEFLSEELEARNWTQAEFAEIIGRPVRLVNEIANGKRTITPETAIQLAAGLGTSSELWLNLESQYQLSKVQPSNNRIKRKAEIHNIFPIRDMAKRGWIDKSTNIEVLEKQCLNFYDISNVNERPQFAHTAKKTTYDDTSMVQLAWLYRAKNIASSQVMPKFSRAKLVKALEELKALMSAPEEARHVVTILNSCGVRFLIVEVLPGSKIDGACFWLSKSAPVIVLSTRFDRIDNFWFVLRHVIEHIIQGDCKNGKPIIDEELDKQSDSLPKCEVIANNAASNFVIDQSELNNYMARVAPYYFSTTKVHGFAARIGVHPGLVVGQLQNRTKDYKFLRNKLVKMRHIVIPSTPSDGWGNPYPV